VCTDEVLMKIPPHLWANDAVAPEGSEHVVDDDGEHCIPVDACIAPAVRALWDAGIVTLASCCGHPEPGGHPWGVITIQTQPGVRQGGAQLVRRERYAELLAAEADLARWRGRAEALMAGITDGGFCKLCDGFGEHPDEIAHRGDCPTRIMAAHRDGEDGEAR